MMAPSGGSSRPSWASSDDNVLFYVLVMVAGLAVGSIALWSSYHAEVSTVIMRLFRWEIAALRHWTHRFDVADQQMAQVAPGAVTLGQLLGMARELGTTLRWPAATIMGCLGLVCMGRSASSRYCRSFGLDGLIREQASSFPVVAAFVDRKLRLTDPSPSHVRPLDPALSPVEWIARYAVRSKGGFDEGRARRALAQQLGPLWRGPDEAAPVVRFLFAVFSLHLTAQREEALTLLGRASVSLQGSDDSPEGPEEPLPFPDAVRSWVDECLHDPALRQPADEVACRHAFTHTALMGLLNAARRRSGVLAPGQFAWLKLVDRPLWYALHSLGFEAVGLGRYFHPNPRAEAAGARDHWTAECLLERSLPMPEVERALAQLRGMAPRPPRRTVSPKPSPSPL